jgi:hypothetical protein
MWITSLQVSSNMLIALKLGWLLLMVVLLIGVFVLMVRRGGKDETPNR